MTELAYPFFTCAKEVYAIDKHAFDCEAILLAGNNAVGDFNVTRPSAASYKYTPFGLSLSKPFDRSTGSRLRANGFNLTSQA